MTLDDQIQAIEDEIAKTKYNKATAHHIGRLKARLAALREKQAKRSAQAGGGGRAFAVAKSGHATVGLVGFPSVGKSTLLNKLTNARSEVAHYAFTTLDIIPGILEHRGARIQVLDMPGIIRGASRGKGRGREVLSVARSVDLLLLVVDPFNPGQLEALAEELESGGIRLNARPPNIQLVKSDRGGVTLSATRRLHHLDEALARDICREFGVVNASLVVREDATPERLIDFLAGNRAYVKALVVIAKTDLVDEDMVQEQLARYRAQRWQALAVSAERGVGLEPLRDAIHDTLGFLRVYLKPPGQEADTREPLVVKRGSTVGDVCDVLHRDFREKFRYALVTGRSAKFKEQTVGLEHELADEDVLTIVVRRT